MQSLTTEFKAEAAKANNRPCELYDIYLGSQDVKDSKTYHFCTDNTKVSFWNLDGDAQDYTPLNLTREPINANSQLSVDSVGGEFDNADLAWSNWIASPITGDLRGKRVVIRRVFLDLLTSSTHCKILFDGIISQVEELRIEKVKVRIRSKISSLSVITGALQNIDCPYILGDDWCGVNNTPITGQTADSGCTTTTVVDAARTEADDYWNRGFIKFTSGQNEGIERTIIDFDADTDTLTLDYALPYAPAEGDTYEIRRGCDQAFDTCKNVFGNQANFGGCKDIPQTMNPVPVEE